MVSEKDQGKVKPWCIKYVPESVTGPSLRPEHLVVDPKGDTLRVDLTESLGGVSYAYLMSDEGERIVVEERGDDRVSEGQRVGLKFEDKRVYLFDAETEARIRT